MSVNWTKKEFAARLKKVDVNAQDVRVGDIVFSDGDPWQVAKIKMNKAGSAGSRYMFFDADDNGFGGVRGEDKIRILVRGAIAKVPAE